MDRYQEAIDYLRDLDGGSNGPAENAAKCLEELLGLVDELETNLNDALGKRAIAEDDAAEEEKRKQRIGAARSYFNRY